MPEFFLWSAGIAAWIMCGVAGHVRVIKIGPKVTGVDDAMLWVAVLAGPIALILSFFYRPLGRDY